MPLHKLTRTQDREAQVLVRKLQAPWSLLLLSVPAFPVHAHTDRYRSLATAFYAELSGASLQSDVFLQVWKFRPDAGMDILDENISWMKPMHGLGIWPNREPPRSWSTNDLSDAAASLFDDSEMALPKHRVLRLTCSPGEQQTAFDLLCGSGTCGAIFAATDFAQRNAELRELVLPRIVEKRFQRAKFYLPLLDGSAVQSLQSADGPTAWLAGADAYLRESGEDNALLMLTQQSPAELVHRVAERTQTTIDAISTE